MRIIPAIISLLFFYQANAQEKYNFDSLTNKLCASFKATYTYPDTVRIDKVFEMHPEIFSRCKTQKELEELYQVLYLRLQMNCPGFDRIADIVNKNEEDGMTISEDPASKINAAACSKLYRQNWFYYLDGESKVNLYINDTTWKSLFPDGTYSLLKLVKKTECEFTVSFIESDNFVIANTLKTGYQFRYKIIEALPGYFNVISEDVATKKKQLFKLYFLN